MNPLRQTIKRSIVSGSVASVLSTAVIAALSAHHTRSPFSGTNSESHGIWGEKAKAQRGLSTRYTGIGFAIHHASSIFWASFFERSLHGKRRPAEIAKNAALTAAGAAAFDYLLMPRRLQPGFEANLSSRSMVSAFISIAAGLAAGRLLFDAMTRSSADVDTIDEPLDEALPRKSPASPANLDGAVI